ANEAKKHVIDIPLNNGSGNGVDTPSNGSIVSGPVDELLGSYIEGGKKNSNFDATLGSSLDPCFPSLSEVTSIVRNQDGGLKEGNTIIVGSTSQVVKVNVVSSGTPNATSASVNDGTLNEGRSSYVRTLIEIDVCNDFGDNLVMVVPNLDGTRYTKEIIRLKHEWKPPRCNKGGSPEVDDEGFVEVKKKKSSGNNGRNKNFKSVSVKPKSQYRPKAKQLTAGANQIRINLLVRGMFRHQASTSGVQEEGQSSTSLVEKIDMFEKQPREGKCVLVDDDDTPLKKVNHSSDQDSEDKIEYVDNEMTSYLASKSLRVGYGTKRLLEQ
nr:hypothetical protein [Tanacetum cinerariifolium]